MFSTLLKHFYTPEIQLGVRQVEAIAGAIYTRQPNCKLLIFGCGNDSPLWFSINKKGRTVFLETSSKWKNTTLAKAPNLEIQLYDLPNDMTVASCLKSDILPDIQPPPILFEETWDVILIDGPPGHNPDIDPGRAMAIKWVSQIRTKKTHVFLDDMNRPLERAYGEKYLDITCQISNERLSYKMMGWSVGISSTTK